MYQNDVKGLAGQLRQSMPTLIKIYAPILLMLFAAIVARVKANIPFEELTRDPLALIAAPVYLGVLSNIGILLWCAAAAICFFAYGLTRNNQSNQTFHAFLLFLAVFTSVLLSDDLFQIHDVIFPYILHIPEKVFYAGYGLTLVFGYIRFRTTMLQTRLLYMLLSFMFFGISLAFDVFAFDMPMNVLIEDGSKLLGIASWLAYSTEVAVQQIQGMKMRAVLPLEQGSKLSDNASHSKVSS